MNVEAYIAIAGALVAIGSLAISWRTAQSSAAKVEAEIAKLAAEKKDIEVSAARGALEATADYARELKARVADLETEVSKLKTLVEAAQTEAAKWRRWFRALCQFVRDEAPNAPLNGFLAQLEAGPRGG